MAFLIDWYIIFFATSPLYRLLEKILLHYHLPTGFDFYFAPKPMEFMIKYIIIGLSLSIITVLYFAILESKFNQSIGKFMMKLYVTYNNNKAKLEQISLKQSLLRSVSLIISGLFIIDIIYAVFNKEKLRLFEKWSKTRTIIITRI